MKFAKHTVTIQGKKASYWKNESEKRPAIVFLHGFPGNHQGLLDLANELAKDYTIIMPDLPGCGESEALEGSHSLAAYAYWLHQFFTALSIAKPVVLGHSFGSRLGLYFAAHYGEQVGPLVLLTPVAKVKGFFPALAWLNFTVARWLPKRIRKIYLANRLYQRIIFFITFKSDNIAKKNEIMGQSMEEVSRLALKVQDEMFDDLQAFDLVSLGDQVHHDCLIIAGAKDEVAPVSIVASLAQRMKNAFVHVVEGTGHLVPIEMPKQTANLIRRWLVQR